MANAVVTLTLNNVPNDKDLTFNHMHVYGTAAISASPGTYPTGGLALSFAGMPVGIEAPSWVEFFTIAGGVYEYRWNKTNGTIQILTDSGNAAQGAPFIEMSNGTSIPAAVSSDVIGFHAIFRRN